MKTLPKTELFETFAIQGMSMRDYFAAKAMQAMLVNRNDASYLEKMPKICYQWADAMMKARNE